MSASVSSAISEYLLYIYTQKRNKNIYKKKKKAGAFFSSTFYFFSAGGALKPGDLTVPWPSTTPTTDRCAGSTRVGVSVSEAEGSLLAVEVDSASRFSFFIL